MYHDSFTPVAHENTFLCVLESGVINAYCSVNSILTFTMATKGNRRCGVWKTITVFPLLLLISILCDECDGSGERRRRRGLCRKVAVANHSRLMEDMGVYVRVSVLLHNEKRRLKIAQRDTHRGKLRCELIDHDASVLGKVIFSSVGLSLFGCVNRLVVSTNRQTVLTGSCLDPCISST